MTDVSINAWFKGDASGALTGAGFFSTGGVGGLAGVGGGHIKLPFSSIKEPLTTSSL